MIYLYVAETSEGFNSSEMETCLSAELKMIFPEVLNGKPRTELELKRYLTSVFDEKKLLSLKNKIAVIYSIVETVLDFFQILILDGKLLPEEMKIIFIDEYSNRIVLNPDQDARFEWPRNMFSVHEQNLTRILEGKLK